MKISHIIILSLVLINNSCIAQNINHQLLFIEYKAQTRGSFLKMILEKDVLTFQTPITLKKINLNKEQIENINKVVDKINLFKITSLKSPSTKRYSDREMAATIKIKKADKEFFSSEFDHENPPKELLELYLLIKKYSKKKGSANAEPFFLLKTNTFLS